MRIVGIVAEYNPFHNGHLYHLKTSLAETGAEKAIAIMSGHFVQRGEPAMWDKWRRTEMALKNGVSLVLELPVFFSTASAEFFAACAVGILNGTGVVDALSFGSESGDLPLLDNAAELLADESNLLSGWIKHYSDAGLPFPKAREKALSSVLGAEAASVLQTPNNILAVEYLKALKKINSRIEPYTMSRLKAAYHSQEISDISSASAIRGALESWALDCGAAAIRGAVPPSVYEIIQAQYENGQSAPNINAYSSILQYLLKTKTAAEISAIADITEGLENRIISCADSEFAITDILNALKTKRFTYTRLQRALLHIILNITKEQFTRCAVNSGARYIRVLGFRKEDAFLLREIEKRGTLPLVTSIKQAEKHLDPTSLEMLQKEIVATDIYSLGAKKSTLDKNQEYTRPLVII